MHRAAALVIGLLATSLATSARADQLQCNSQENAERAVALLVPGSILIDYCSMCDAEVKVVRVREAKAVKDCMVEVAVYGTLVARTGRTFREKYDPRAKYRAAQGDYGSNIDLAYAYVETAPNRFSWLGGVLGLKASVNTRTIRLPKDLYATFGEHPMPSLQQPAAERAPTRLRQLGFNLFKDRLLAAAISAFDAGKLDAAKAKADQALDELLGRRFSGFLPPRHPYIRNPREMIERGLGERLMRASLPLQNIMVGYALKRLEDWPTKRLERAMAVLAVWAAVTAAADNAGDAIDQASVALLLDPMTAADLYRRAPRAAMLARFYAALYHLGVAGGGPRPHDAQVVTRRLAESFDQQAGAFQGNYGAALKRLLR